MHVDLAKLDDLSNNIQKQSRAENTHTPIPQRSAPCPLPKSCKRIA